MHPLAPMVDRVCCKNVTFPEHGLHLEEGTSILIPVYGLHFDPQYFPDPQKFDPERFSDENKCNIQPFTYLPFGEGPRHCIGTNIIDFFYQNLILILLGKRFALLELKLGLSNIISKHDLHVCEKTNVKVPFEYAKGTTQQTLQQPEGGFWLNVKPLSEE
jgi:cytochrome P450